MTKEAEKQTEQVEKENAIQDSEFELAHDAGKTSSDDGDIAEYDDISSGTKVQTQGQDEDVTGNTDEKGKDKSGEDAAADDEGRPAQPRRYQKRINKLTHRATEAERENDRLRAENEQLKAAQKAAEDRENAPKAPDPSDFENVEEYIEAKAEYLAAQKAGSTTKDDAGKETGKDEETDNDYVPSDEETHAGAVIESINSLIEDAEGEDYAEVVRNQEVPFNVPLLEMVLDSDDPEKLLYQLAQDKKAVKDITSATSTASMARRLAKFEAEAAKGKTAPPRKQSDAPEPIEPESGSPGSVSKPASELDPDSYMRKRNKELKEQGKALW